MRLAIEIFAVYFIYAFGTSLLVWRYSVRDRGPIIVVTWVIPLMVIASLFELIFLTIFRRSPCIRPCPEGLDETELIVERHRQQMFGGEPVEPHFASDWARLYTLTLEQEAERVQRFARRVRRVLTVA